MIQQTIDKASQITYAASASTTSLGLWMWMGKHADAIGALCALIGLFIGIVTCIVNWYYKHKATKQ